MTPQRPSAASGAQAWQRRIITDLKHVPSVWRLQAELQWAVDGIIAQGSVIIICAESGTGKTWLGYHLAGWIAHCRQVLGRSVQRPKEFHLDGENPLYTIKERLSDPGITATDELTTRNR
jgi:RecA-family ATPase